MIFKSLKTCKWSVNSDTYELTEGSEIEIKDEYTLQAKASKLFVEVEKEIDAKSNKRKVTSKSSDIK